MTENFGTSSKMLGTTVVTRVNLKITFLDPLLPVEGSSNPIQVYLRIVLDF